MTNVTTVEEIEVDAETGLPILSTGLDDFISKVQSTSAWSKPESALKKLVESYDQAISAGSVIVSQEDKSPILHMSEEAFFVAMFMRLANQKILNHAGCPADDVRILRAKLLLEEVLELIKCLGVEVNLVKDYVSLEITDTSEMSFSISDTPFDLEGVIDGVLDVSVVNTGTALSCGFLPSPTLIREVGMNNLSKFRKDKDGYSREDGKWVKPSDHPAPRLLLACGYSLSEIHKLVELLKEPAPPLDGSIH